MSTQQLEDQWLTDLFGRYSRAVLAYARRRLDSGEDAEDVVVEVFATAWRRREVVPDEALPWLYATAGNVIAHVIRSDSRRTRLGTRLATVRPLHTTEDDPAQQVVDATAAHDVVSAALDDLSESDAELLRLWAWEQLEPAEIAEVLGCSPGTARTRMHRARARLRDALVQRGVSGPGIDGPRGRRARDAARTGREPPHRHTDHPQRLGGHPMNTQSTEDRADEALRALLTQADPEAGAPQPEPTHLLDRVRAAAAAGEAPPAGAPEGALSPPVPLAEHRSFTQKHWQGMLMAAAGVATLALAAGTVLPGLTASSGSDSAASIGVSDTAGGSEALAGAVTDKGTGVDGSVGAPEAARDTAVSSEAMTPTTGATTGVPGADTTDEALVRSGSVLVGTEDPEAARDAFVATILAMGGRVTSESVVTDGGGGVQPYGPEVSMSRDMGMSYPYPWYPSGPGIWLTVQVPVDDYDEAMEAARGRR